MSTEEEKQEFLAKDLTVTSVTVYRDRAEVKRLLKTLLKAGKNELVVSDVSAHIDKDSVRVDGRGPAIICDVQYKETPVHKGQADHDRIKQLQHDKDQLEKKLKVMEDALKVLNRQGEVLDGVATQVGKGVTHKDDKDDKSTFALTEESFNNLTNFLGFYERTIADVQQKLRRSQDELKEVQEQVHTITRQIDDLSFGESGDWSRQVTIVLDSEKGGEIELDIIYQVYGASWKPSYDIRVFTNSDDKQKDTLKLYYYGLVEQNTGEDWMAVPLMLSTATPSVGGVVPTLDTLTVGIKAPPPPPPPPPPPQPFAMQQTALFGSVSNESGFGGGGRMMKMAAPMPDMDRAVMQVESNVVSACFGVGRACTVPSDGTEHQVNVTVVELEPTLEHETVPAKTPLAFLTAKSINTSTFPFLPGPSSIYLNNSFVAKSWVKAVSPEEEFECSLGMDQSVRVEFRPVHKFHEQTGFVSKAAVDTNEQLIDIHNTRNQSITIKLLHQIPKSTDDKVKVTLLHPELPQNGDEGKDVSLNRDHNLEWKIKIPATKKRELKIKWKIEYPVHEKLEFSG